MALGPIKALGDCAGRDVHVVGFDGTPEALRAVADGTMVATIAQQPELLGREAIEQAVRAARREVVRQVVDVPVKVVTKHNVADFRSEDIRCGSGVRSPRTGGAPGEVLPQQQGRGRSDVRGCWARFH
jgi:ABC-type sugar transport system substrate-binding protein